MELEFVPRSTENKTQTVILTQWTPGDPHKSTWPVSVLLVNYFVTTTYLTAVMQELISLSAFIL
jgi:hypothetical protein